MSWSYMNEVSSRRSSNAEQLGTTWYGQDRPHLPRFTPPLVHTLFRTSANNFGLLPSHHWTLQIRVNPETQGLYR